MASAAAGEDFGVVDCRSVAARAVVVWGVARIRTAIVDATRARATNPVAMAGRRQPNCGQLKLGRGHDAPETGITDSWAIAGADVAGTARRIPSMPTTKRLVSTGREPTAGFIAGGACTDERGFRAVGRTPSIT